MCAVGMSKLYANAVTFKLIFATFKFIICVYAHMCAHSPWHMHEDQRTTCRNLLPSSSM